MTDQQISEILFSLKDGQVEVIGGRCVLREGGWLYLEGFKNRKFSWNQAIPKLRKPKKVGPNPYQMEEVR